MTKHVYVKFTILISLLFLVFCGSRQAKVYVYKDDFKQKTIIATMAEYLSNDGENSSDIEDTGYDLYVSYRKTFDQSNPTGKISLHLFMYSSGTSGFAKEAYFLVNNKKFTLELDNIKSTPRSSVTVSTYENYGLNFRGKWEKRTQMRAQTQNYNILSADAAVSSALQNEFANLNQMIVRVYLGDTAYVFELEESDIKQIDRFMKMRKNDKGDRKPSTADDDAYGE